MGHGSMLAHTGAGQRSLNPFWCQYGQGIVTALAASRRIAPVHFHVRKRRVLGATGPHNGRLFERTGPR